jgi:hypothetical protein
MLIWLFTILLLLEAGVMYSRPLRKKGRIWSYSVMSCWGCNFPCADPRVCSSPTALSSWRVMWARSELVGCCLLAARRERRLWVAME